jgi:hypothetical protein
MTPYVVGIVLAVLTFVTLGFARLDRDGAAYPVVLIVVATYYILFAAIGGSRSALIAESLGAVVFVIIALVGFRSSAWIIIAGLAAHGLFDLIHASVITDPGVPVWWPAFCSSFDVGLAILLGFRLARVPRAISG